MPADSIPLVHAVIPGIALVFALVSIFHSKIVRISSWVVAASLLFLEIVLVSDASSAWIGGSGTLRGIWRGFTPQVRGNHWGTWNSFSILLGLGCFLLLSIAPEGRRRRRSTSVAILGILGLMLCNSVELLLLSWSLVCAAGLASAMDPVNCSAAGSRGQVGVCSKEAVAAGISVFSVGILCAALAAQGGFGELYGVAGHGGAMDVDGLSQIRHATLSIIGFGHVSLSVLFPVLIALAVFSVALMPVGTINHACGLGAVAGPLFLLKIYPLAELGMRGGSALLLTLFGLTGMAWAGFRNPDAPSRHMLILSGGTLALLGAKLPAGALMWALLWMPTVFFRQFASNGVTILVLIGSFLLLTPYSSLMQTHGPWTWMGSLLGVFSVGVSMAWNRSGKNNWRLWAGTGIILLLVVCSFLLSSMPFWTPKTHYSFPRSPVPWLVTGAVLLLGFMLRNVLFSMIPQLSGGYLCTMEERFNRVISSWVVPVADVVAVIWVALERFAWQGITLFGPRRALVGMATYIAWIERIVLTHIRLIPAQLVDVAGSFSRRAAGSPAVVATVTGLLIAAAWFFGGGR